MDFLPKVRLILVCMSASFLLFLSSCVKDAENLTETNSTEGAVESWKATPDDDLILFAKALANSQKRPDIRSFLDDWFKKDQLGNSFVFFLQIAGENVTPDETFVEILQQSLSETGTANSRSEFFAALIVDYPNLGFSLFPGSDEIEISDFVYDSPVKVVPETQAFRALEENSEPGYDENLSQTLFSNNEMPDEPVIVLRNSQTYVLLRADTGAPIPGSGGGVLETLINQCAALATYITWAITDLNELEEFEIIDGELVNNPEYDIIAMELSTLYTAYNIHCVDIPADNPDSDPLGTLICDRDERINGREDIIKMEIEHNQLVKFCKWWDKTCTVEVTQTFAVNPEELTLQQMPVKFITRKRKRMKENKQFWVPEDFNLFRWEYLEGTHGDPYALSFIGIHADPDGSKTFTFGFNANVTFKLGEGILNAGGVGLNLGFSRTIANNHLELGGDVVHYCDDANWIDDDNIGTTYTSGIVDALIIEGPEE